MKILTLAFLVAVFFTPSYGIAQQSTAKSNDIKIELTKENKFVVKIMDVIDKSGKKIPGLIELDSFSFEKKIFTFRNSKRKLRKISDGEIKKIVFTRLRQGILTGKPPSLRVIVWNGKIKNFELGYRDLKIKNGYLYLSQHEVAKHFDDSDTIRASSNEWSDKFNNFWNRKKEDSPDDFATHFAYQDGHGVISRTMAATYCRDCLKIEILDMQINPAKETILIRCKDVFYDRYNE